MKEKNILRDIFDTIEEGVLILDNNYKIELANQNFLELFKIDKISLIGKSFFEILDRSLDRAEIHKIFEGLKSKKDAPTKFSFKKSIPDAGEKTILFNARNLTSEFFPSHIFVIFQDITEAENHKIRIQQIEKQLITAQRLESIALLASGIAHDLNNIFGVIIGFSELSMKSIGMNHPLSENLIRISDSALKGAQITRQLLAFSRRQVLTPQDINLNDIVRDTIKLLSKTLGEHIELNFIHEKNLRTIYADPIQIEQILMNLCINARDAMPDGGKLIIETSNVTLEQEYIDTHISAKIGDYTLLTVTDTGEGMSEEIKNKIFEPFFTTKESGKGTGLGLSVVHGIVYQHNGFINVYSEVGKGTTFKIYFPSVNRPAIGKGDYRKEEVQGGKEKILLVEDESGLREMLKSTLESFGYFVLAAGNGEEALKILSECREKIDIIISDVVMPKMSGKQLYEKLSETNYRGAFLFISGYTQNVIHHNFILDPGIEVLMKPFTPIELGKKIRSILDKK